MAGVSLFLEPAFLFFLALWTKRQAHFVREEKRPAGRPTRAKPRACVYRSLSVLARTQTCRAETSEKQRRMLAVHKMSEPAVGIIRDSYRESNLSPGAGACFAADDTSGSTRPCDWLQADRQAAKSTATLSGPYFSTMCTVYMPVSVCFF